ncbi:hypothetical protein QTL86_11255 [Cellulosilyticum sp. ST5]|uniref:hypothetical protein n=1 Tax=Cellulosilyticum sp. ST5 TaxID=3055805 RepID=UPI003977B99E
MIKFEDYPCWQCRNLDDMGGCKLNDNINPVWLTEDETNRFKCFKYDKVAVSYRRVREYIEKCRYTYKVEDIIEDYSRKWNHGFYVSYTMRDVIEHCEIELRILERDSTN